MEASANALLEGEQLPTSMSLGFEHVQSYQIRRNNPPKQFSDAPMDRMPGKKKIESFCMSKQLSGEPSRRCRTPVRATERQATYPHSHRISERVLSMRRLGGASAVPQFVVDIPLQLIEANGSIGAKQQVWVKKWSNEEGSGKKMATLMEEEIPEPNAPL